MKKVITLILILLAISLNIFASNKELVKLSRILDGDTIEIINSKNELEMIRFDGIDCYETSLNPRAYKQAYEDKITVEEVIKLGIQSKLVLVKLFKENSDKSLYLERCNKDKYDRAVGKLYLDQININEYMIKHGNAKKYVFIKY